MTAARLRPLPAALSLLIAACASVAPHGNGPETRPLRGSAISHEDIAVGHAKPGGTSNGTDDWAALRASFAMDDCDSDPAILSWARQYTRNTDRFESQMLEVLPRLAYVQSIAKQHGVPGEFVLLPWVESGFRPLLGQRSRPAGMWQIMPATASSIGLRVDGHYDGRLDVPAAADAVMSLLARYYEQLHDWRLVNYAFNAGEFSIQKMLQQYGPPPAEPAIPKWPVRRGTREHLVKLLAIACVIREPGRFGVTLPQLPSGQHLVAVTVPAPMPVSRVADQAGMDSNELSQLNAGLRDGIAGKPSTPYLLMPRNKAEQLNQALLQPQNPGDAPLSAFQQLDAAAADDAGDSSPAGRKQAAPLDDRPHSGKPARHTVSKGESLWSIARRYHVPASELARWNHLKGNTIKPGQRLAISPPNAR